ncbi:hypothetical protein BJ742DRAFT_773234 [Cladochytrium replicatum]|nr:hypothetical protein BJ742DRAFT_773234 [Cladochytrium replicatum]
MNVVSSEIMITGGAIVCAITAATCFWEDLEKITNKFLCISMLLFLFFFILTEVFYITGLLLFVRGLPGIGALTKAVCGITWILAWACMTFHSTMRTALIVLPLSAKIPPWGVGLMVTLLQLTLASASVYYYVKAIIESDGHKYDKQGSFILLLEAVWYSIVESGLFLAAQYKIVSAALELQNAVGGNTLPRRRSLNPLKHRAFWIFMMGGLRALCYSANIIMTFISIGGYFPPYTDAFLFFFILTEVFYITGLLLFVRGLPGIGALTKAVCGITWILAWACMTFHSTMRTALIVLPLSAKIPPWGVGLMVTLLQLTLASASVYYYVKAIIESDGK